MDFWNWDLPPRLHAARAAARRGEAAACIFCRGGQDIVSVLLAKKQTLRNLSTSTNVKQHHKGGGEGKGE